MDFVGAGDFDGCAIEGAGGKSSSSGSGGGFSFPLLAPRTTDLSGLSDLRASVPILGVLSTSLFLLSSDEILLFLFAAAACRVASLWRERSLRRTL